MTAPVKPPPPAVVRRRDLSREPVPAGGGVEAFDVPEALALNHARLDHLASLALPLSGRRVLDVGAGVGHLARFFAERGTVVCVDGRAENVAELRRRQPGIEAHVLDVEREALGPLGRFDVVFCYGLVYHLEGILAGLRNMASVCDDLLLLETLVCDASQPVAVMVDEPRVHNQALGQVAHRPSPSYVVMALDRIGFPHVYAPRDVPDHPDFHFERRDDLAVGRDGRNLRCVFVASRRPIDSGRLVSLLEG